MTGGYAFDEAWQDYLAAERTCVKAKWHEALKRFLVVFHQASPWAQAAWAYEKVMQAAQEPGSVPMRRPLVAQGLIPALIQGALNREPGAIKAVVGILCEGMGQIHGQRFLSQTDEVVKEFCGRYRDEVEMAADALACNPGDRDIQGWIIKRLDGSLWFLIHELPAGLLLDFGTKTSAKEDLQAQLQDADLLEKVAREHECLDRYAVLIRNVRFHCRHYDAYLKARRQNELGAGTYEEYLSARGEDVRAWMGR